MNSPKPHPHADILRAIADGKKIQGRAGDSLPWIDADLEDVVREPHVQFRIAPETVLINGVECPKPVVKPNAVACVISIVLGGTNINQYAFSTEADAKTVFDALCKPFKESK